MTEYREEQLEIIRRIAERGLKKAVEGALPNAEAFGGSIHYQYIDIFQHILDELERI